MSHVFLTTFPPFSVYPVVDCLCPILEPIGQRHQQWTCETTLSDPSVSFGFASRHNPFHSLVFSLPKGLGLNCAMGRQAVWNNPTKDLWGIPSG